MHRTGVFILAVVFSLSAGFSSPVSAEHREPTAPHLRDEVQSPISSTVPLGGDEKHRSVVDLDIITAADSRHGAIVVDRMRVTELESVSAWT